MIDELDKVKLKETYKGIAAGSLAIVVLMYTDTECEVEFIDEYGNTAGFMTVPVELLELVEPFKYGF